MDSFIIIYQSGWFIVTELILDGFRIDFGFTPDRFRISVFYFKYFSIFFRIFESDFSVAFDF